MPCYGYRHITAELRRRSFKVSHKTVLRLLREDNLLCLRRKRAFVVVIDSRYTKPVYTNLARDMRRDLINQLSRRRHHLHSSGARVHLPGGHHGRWQSPRDRLGLGEIPRRENDASGVVVGFTDAREFTPELVRHSDRGVQYACADYIELLIESSIRISMSHTANPYERLFESAA